APGDDRGAACDARRSRGTAHDDPRLRRERSHGALSDMPIRLETLLKRVPSDTARRVEETKARLNASIRRFLREETGLRLSGGTDGNADDRTSVPVRLAPGLSRCLRGRTLDDDM